MSEDTFREMEKLRVEILETGAILKKLLIRDLARMDIRKKHWYLIPDWILKFFYSEFRDDKDE